MPKRKVDYGIEVSFHGIENDIRTEVHEAVEKILAKRWGSCMYLRRYGLYVPTKLKPKPRKP